MGKPLRKYKYETSYSVFFDTFQISAKARKDARNITEKIFLPTNR